MSSIWTYTGLEFNFVDPDPEQIRIEDIAHSLSMQCRFGGHTKCFYSVAQHSLILADMVESEEDKRIALLHDAAEAYLGDVVGPVKRNVDGYIQLEWQLLWIIFKKFGLNVEMRVKDSGLDPLSQVVKEADHLLFKLEADYLIYKKVDRIKVDERSYAAIMLPHVIEHMFLSKFGELFYGR